VEAVAIYEDLAKRMPALRDLGRQAAANIRNKIIKDGKLRDNSVDLGITLVQVFAEVSDLLSYYQDAIATETYLGIARRRQSLRCDTLRRHLRRARAALRALVSIGATERNLAVNIGEVVSKYIGETETNLKRLFDAAETSGTVLLFDEADALFGNRSKVRDSHDRYANIEVGYLLQRVEAYRGLVYTTKMRRALDRAFMRRIRFVFMRPWPPLEGDRLHRDQFPTKANDHDAIAQCTVAGLRTLLLRLAKG
jgi:hypothetical protein